MHLLSPRLRRQFSGYTSWEALRGIRERFVANAWEKTPVKWMTYLDLSFRLPELLLMRVDKMGMGVSLEARVPFLDHKFVELAMGIPEAIITKNDQRKYILKKAVRGIIPDEIIDRKKQGFGVPIYEWFFDHLGSYARREVAAFCEATDFLDRDAVGRMMGDAGSSGVPAKSQGWYAWVLLNFALWWKEYIESPEAQDRELLATVGH